MSRETKFGRLRVCEGVERSTRYCRVVWIGSKGQLWDGDRKETCPCGWFLWPSLTEQVGDLLRLSKMHMVAEWCGALKN